MNYDNSSHATELEQTDGSIEQSKAEESVSRFGQGFRPVGA